MSWYEALLVQWSNLVITFVGVLLGAFFGTLGEWWVARWASKREEAGAERLALEQLTAHLDRVKTEIRDNEGTVELLDDVLARAASANMPAAKSLLEWATKLAHSLSTAAYDDLVRSGLHRRLPEDMQGDLFDASHRTSGLRFMVEASGPAVEFYLGFSIDKHLAKQRLDNALTYGRTVRQTLSRAKQIAFEQAEKLRKGREKPRP